MEAVKTNEPTDNYKEADISINGQETETNLYFTVTYLADSTVKYIHAR